MPKVSADSNDVSHPDAQRAPTSTSVSCLSCLLFIEDKTRELVLRSMKANGQLDATLMRHEAKYLVFITGWMAQLPVTVLHALLY